MRRVILTAVLIVGLAAPASGQSDAGSSDIRDVDAIAWGQTTSGVNFELGRGVMRNYVEAAIWYRRAAERGYAPAQNSLAKLYELGWGLPQDLVQAHLWYSLTADSGHTVAALNRNNLAPAMTPAQIAEARRLAREWKPKKE